MSRISFKFFVAVCLTIFEISATASTLSTIDNGATILISGRIEPGDFKKFAQFVNSKQRIAALMTWVALDSPGGDVSEAMRFSRFFEEAYIRVKIPEGGTCASACFLMWAGAVDRVLMPDARLGVHRISWTSASLDMKRNEQVVSPVAKSVEGFLEQAGIPRKIIDKFRETPPTDVTFIDTKWLIQQDVYDAVAYRPMFLDVVEKKCGVNPASMNRGKLPSRERLEQWMDCGGELRIDLFLNHLDQIVNTLQKARSAK